MIERDDILAREIIRENTAGKDPELALADDFLGELELRLEQVKVYYPVMELLRKRKTDDELSKLVPELCFLILSYLIYEGKLKYKGITFKELQSFLGKALQRILSRDIDAAAVGELTAQLLDGLQNGGRNFTLNTYSFKSGSLREKYIKFLEIKQTGDGALQYYVTEQGVDFYLRTKEFPEETKITVNLLLFQKQMEKGAFGFAYETVRRLNMEVQKKKDRKYSLLEALMYGRQDSGEAYNSYHRSIVLQFREEAELFNSALKNVRSAFDEYVERINSGQATEKERRTFTLIKIIEKEIGRAQTLHTELLREAAGFTKEYDKTLGLRRKAIFTERFNFQGELEKLVNKNGKPEALKFLFEPLLEPHLKKSFNILRAFEPQRLAKSRQEEEESREGEEPVYRETSDQLTSSRVRRNFLFYAARLLEALDTPGRQVTLQDFCRILVERYTEDSVYNGDFLSFLLEMNRDKPPGLRVRTIDFADGRLQVEEELKTMEEIFFRAALAARLEGKINRVRVQSFPEEEVELLPGLKITNMLFEG
jgi:hypothetical protein